MAKGFDLGAVLADVSKLDTDSSRLQKIDIDLLLEDERNFYSLDGIDELAENIEFIGLQQPLLVRPDPDEPGKFRVISGHRRRAAIRMIVDAGNDAFRAVPCIVEEAAGSDELQELKLIYANSDTRTMSSADVANQAERVEALLYALKEQGVEFPGRMRDHIAEVCKVSQSKLARLKVIRENLIDEIKKLWTDGDLSESSAYKIAQEDQEVQALLVKYFKIKKIKNSYSWAITNAIDNIKNIFRRKCSYCKDGCENVDEMLKAVFSRDEYKYSCEYCCCKDCPRLGTCEISCPATAQEAADKKAQEEERRQKDKEASEQEERKAIDYIRGAWCRWDSARRAAGKTVKECLAALDDYYFGEDLEEELPGYIDGSGVNRYTDMPFDVDEDQVLEIVRCADLFGCSIDYLFGRTDSMKPAPAAEPTPASEAAPAWKEGAPNQTGDVIAVLEVAGLKLKKLCWYDHISRDFYFARGGQKIDGAKCVRWYAVPSDQPAE